MQILLISVVGEDPDPVMVGVREYPVRKLVLLHRSDAKATVRDVEERIRPLKLDIERRQIEGDVVLATIQAITRIVAEHGPSFDDVYVNISGGNEVMAAAALSGAFVNGGKAFSVRDGTTHQMPVLKFSYRNLVGDSKFKILWTLEEAGGHVESLTDLSELSGLEKSLLSYHIRGGGEAEGLEALGLVEVDRGLQGRLEIHVTPMGELLLSGREPLHEGLMIPPVGSGMSHNGPN